MFNPALPEIDQVTKGLFWVQVGRRRFTLSGAQTIIARLPNLPDFMAEKLKAWQSALFVRSNQTVAECADGL